MAMTINKNASVLICDDDDDDVFLIKSVLEDIQFNNNITYLQNGVELIDHLNYKVEDATVGLILLDLNMPKKNGREALKEIKANPKLRRIPVVILTTSDTQQDIDQCYALGANSYITKPSSYEELYDAIDTLIKFWFGLSQLPINRRG
jgi:two-component system, response regulator